MPTQLNNASIDAILSQIKPEIRQMGGYITPPQGDVPAKLNQNENPFDFPQSWKEEIFQTMQSISWTRYPANGAPEIRALLAKRFNLTPDQVMLGNGSNQLLYTIVLAIIGSGDTLLMTPPSFSLFSEVATLYQANLVQVQLNSDFSLNEEEVLKAAKDAKLILLCSPNNPTGNEIPISFLETLLGSTSGIVMWDEAYAEFSEQSATGLIDQYPNLIISRTFSKAFGLAGLRIGYFLGNARLIAELQKANLPYNLNLFSEQVCKTLLSNDAWVQKHVQLIKDERETLYQNMLALKGVTVYPSQANFLLCKVDNGPVVIKALQNSGILVRNMGAYPLLENHFRVTIGKPEENALFLESMKQILMSN